MHHHPGVNFLPSGASLEFLIAFCPGEYDVDPNSHRLRRWRHQMEGSLVRFDAEGQFGVWGFDGVEVIDVHFLDGLWDVKRWFLCFSNYLCNSR